MREAISDLGMVPTQVLNAPEGSQTVDRPLPLICVGDTYQLVGIS